MANNIGFLNISCRKDVTYRFLTLENIGTLVTNHIHLPKQYYGSDFYAKNDQDGFRRYNTRFICDVSYNGGAEQKHRYKEPTDEGIFYRSYEYDYGFTRKLYDRCDNYEMCLKDAVEKKYDTKEFSKTKPQPTSIWRSSSPYTPENYDDWNRYYYTLHEAGKLNYYKDENGAFVCHHVKDCDTTDKNGMCTVS